MSAYLGFSPTDRPNYFFVSYNSEDAERVGRIAQLLAHANLPLWYDYGLEYGEKWEESISGKIKNAQAILLFFTKGILAKENSYVRKEYIMATQFFDKKVYAVMVDNIEKGDIPDAKIAWWIDIQDRQTLSLVGIEDPASAASLILAELGMESHEEKMNSLIASYKDLYDTGRREEAEAFLSEYLHGVGLRGKAELLASLLNGGVASFPYTSAVKEYTAETVLKHDIGKPSYALDECYVLTLGDREFVIGTATVFRRGTRGDACVLHVWRDGERIFTAGGIIEAYKLTVSYDKTEDTVYIGYCSTKENQVGDMLEEMVYQSILTVERPGAEAICNDFRFMRRTR